MLSDPPKTYYRKKGLNPIKNWLRSKVQWFNYPFISAYRGFGNKEKLIIPGHVFRSIALAEQKYSRNILNTSLALLKRYLLKVLRHVKVTVKINGKKYETLSDSDGFFQFEIYQHGLSPGWNKLKLVLDKDYINVDEEVSVQVEVFIPGESEYGFISDIDDTFIVSHSTKIFRKLYLLLTKEPATRKPFEGVVEHYRLLHGKDKNNRFPNPFFYVSSSEWNLYDFIIEFCEIHEFPRGVLFLNDLKKKFWDIIRSGGGSHYHKLDKIRLIMDTYPDLKFILLGDSGQKDPIIYHSITKERPEQVEAVYIRDVRKSKRKKVNLIEKEFKKMGIDLVFFSDSLTAQKHSEEQNYHDKEKGR